MVMRRGPHRIVLLLFAWGASTVSGINAERARDGDPTVLVSRQAQRPDLVRRGADLSSDEVLSIREKVPLDGVLLLGSALFFAVVCMVFVLLAARRKERGALALERSKARHDLRIKGGQGGLRHPPLVPPAALALGRAPKDTASLLSAPLSSSAASRRSSVALLPPGEGGRRSSRYNMRTAYLTSPQTQTTFQPPPPRQGAWDSQSSSTAYSTPQQEERQGSPTLETMAPLAHTPMLADDHQRVPGRFPPGSRYRDRAPQSGAAPVARFDAPTPTEGIELEETILPPSPHEALGFSGGRRPQPQPQPQPQPHVGRPANPAMPQRRPTRRPTGPRGAKVADGGGAPRRSSTTVGRGLNLMASRSIVRRPMHIEPGSESEPSYGGGGGVGVSGARRALSPVPAEPSAGGLVDARKDASFYYHLPLDYGGVGGVDADAPVEYHLPTDPLGHTAVVPTNPTTVYAHAAAAAAAATTPAPAYEAVAAAERPAYATYESPPPARPQARRAATGWGTQESWRPPAARAGAGNAGEGSLAYADAPPPPPPPPPPSGRYHALSPSAAPQYRDGVPAPAAAVGGGTPRGPRGMTPSPATWYEVDDGAIGSRADHSLL